MKYLDYRGMKEYYTIDEVCKMIANEELPAVKVGREWRVLKAGIMEFFETNL